MYHFLAWAVRVSFSLTKVPSTYVFVSIRSVYLYTWARFYSNSYFVGEWKIFCGWSWSISRQLSLNQRVSGIFLSKHSRWNCIRIIVQQMIAAERTDWIEKCQLCIQCEILVEKPVKFDSPFLVPVGLTGFNLFFLEVGFDWKIPNSDCGSLSDISVILYVNNSKVSNDI